MRQNQLEDRLYFGQGIVARHTGAWSDAYRPRGASNPLSLENRYLRLPAQLTPLGATVGAEGPQKIFWSGTFDGRYTSVGDYIVSNGRIFFISSQEPFQPIICVRTNRTIFVTRQMPMQPYAATGYGGIAATDALSILSDYPVAIQIESKSSTPNAKLPTDLAIPYWVIQMPQVDGVSITSGDLVTDDLGRSANVSWAEQSYAGWRILAKPAAA